MSTVSRVAWRSWNAQTWGRMLFDYFFVSAGGDTRPVSRLALGPDELAKASGLSGIDAHDVRDAFLGSPMPPERVSSVFVERNARSWRLAL